MSRIRKAANLPPYLLARRYIGTGDVYGETKLLKRTQTPGVDHEAVHLYHGAGVQVVRVFMPDATMWVCRTENLIKGEEVRRGGIRLLTAPMEHWTVSPSPIQSLF